MRGDMQSGTACTPLFDVQLDVTVEDRHQHVGAAAKPDGAEEQANCLQLALNAADIWAECYPARQSEDEGKEYTETRLPKWLSTLELFHDKTSGGGACECSGDEPPILIPGAGRC